MFLTLASRCSIQSYDTVAHMLEISLCLGISVLVLFASQSALVLI